MTGEYPAIRTAVERVEGQDLSGGYQGVHFTQLISTGINPVAQLLGRDYDRLEARILACDYPVVLAQSREIAEAAAAAAGTGLSTMQSISSQGAQTSPTAGKGITSMAVANLVPGQQYRLDVYYFVDGTSASPADDNNMKIFMNGGGFGVLPWNGSGSDAQPVHFTLPVSPEVTDTPISIEAIGAATAGAIYNATLVATPITIAAMAPGIQSGGYLPAGIDRVLRNCDELWVAATSATPGRVSVAVSRRLPVEPDDRP